ncbi:MAG: UDP-N-acetylmuramate--alanine ligase [Burkholderiaceae bacterium]
MPRDPLLPSGDDRGPRDLRSEVAAAAAGLIADHALDYASAKFKAAESLGCAGMRQSLPDNEDIDAALLAHLQLFDEDHEARVRRRREVALELMEMLSDHDPMLTGAVWKGIVAEHAPIHLQAFSDNAKDLAIDLLNRNIRFDAVTVPHLSGRGEAEALAFFWRDEPVLLATYDRREMRSAPRKGSRPAERGSRQALIEKLRT